MIEWGREGWGTGQNVHYSESGSWLDSERSDES